MIIDELFEAPQQCPECGGISFSDLILAEKKDACYYKVKASAKVWPSAYASGRLVQCRKKGAANYGNKSEGVAEGFPLGKVLSFPDLVGQVKHILDAKHRSIGWKMSKRDDDVFLFSAMNDYDVRSMLIVAKDQDGWVSATNGFVDPYGKAEMFDKQELPMTLASASEIADEAISTYHGIDLSDYADKELDDQGMAEGSLEEYGDTAKGQKMLTKVQKRAVDRVVSKKAETDPKYAKKNADTADRAWDRMSDKDLEEEWSQKYKSSINCANPKGFSQKAHCAGRNKNEDVAEGVMFGAENLNVGDDVIVSGDVNLKGATGVIDSFGQDKRFVVVDLYNHGKHSFHSSDVSANDYDNDEHDDEQGMAEGEQQKGADYRDPKEVDYDDEYDAMVARVKKLAGLGPMKTVYDPAKRQYRNMPTAVQPKK